MASRSKSRSVLLPSRSGLQPRGDPGSVQAGCFAENSRHPAHNSSAVGCPSPNKPEHFSVFVPLRYPPPPSQSHCAAVNLCSCTLGVATQSLSAHCRSIHRCALFSGWILAAKRRLAKNLVIISRRNELKMLFFQQKQPINRVGLIFPDRPACSVPRPRILRKRFGTIALSMKPNILNRLRIEPPKCSK